MKQRIISAIVALAIIIPVIIIGGDVLIIALSLIAMLAYKEITDIKLIKNNIPTLVKVIGVFVYLLIVIKNVISLPLIDVNYIELVIATIGILVPSIFYKNNKYTSTNALYFLALIIFVGYCFNGLMSVGLNIEMLIYLILISILSDTFAMFTGMLIGKHKLCPEVSPKKTIEGSIGGLIIGVVVPLIIYNYLINSVTIPVIVVTIILAITSQFGDLIFSKIKRDNDIKDFSNIMPGHGGILDRLDSILFVSLVYMVISTFI